jgi:hypothetical protein
VIPASIAKAALAKGAQVGREYDSAGKHVAFWYAVTPEWRVYRHSVSGMLALLRQVRRSA